MCVRACVCRLSHECGSMYCLLIQSSMCVSQCLPTNSSLLLLHVYRQRMKPRPYSRSSECPHVAGILTAHVCKSSLLFNFKPNTACVRNEMYRWMCTVQSYQILVIMVNIIHKLCTSIINYGATLVFNYYRPLYVKTQYICNLQ